MKITKTITRDSNTSFAVQSKRQDGVEFFKKVEKGSPEYSNICNDFRKKNVEIEVGNTISE